MTANSLGYAHTQSTECCGSYNYSMWCHSTRDPIAEMSSRARSYQVSFSGQVGTPLYMSPEQLEHTRCTEKVDIYALGVIYFEMNCVFQTDHEKLKVSGLAYEHPVAICYTTHTGNDRSAEGMPNTCHFH